MALAPSGAQAPLQPDDIVALEKIKADGTYDELKKKMVALLKEDVSQPGRLLGACNYFMYHWHAAPATSNRHERSITRSAIGADPVTST